MAGQSSDHACGQIAVLESNSQSQVSRQPLIPSVNPKLSKKPAACSITGPLLGLLKSSTAKRTAAIVNESSLPSVSTGNIAVFLRILEPFYPENQYVGF